MNAAPEEVRAARLFLGELSPEEAGQVRHDAACADVLGRMQATVDALRAWPQAHSMTLRPPAPTAWRWLAACAAALLVVLAGAFLFRPRPGSTPTPTPPSLAGELAWTAQAISADDSASAWGGQPPGRKGGGYGRGGAPTPVPKLAFPSRIPEVVADSFAFDRGESVTQDRAWLRYRKGDRTFLVFVCKSAGPDSPFEELKAGDRPLVARRKAGVLFAFDAGVLDRAQLDSLILEFEEKK